MTTTSGTGTVNIAQYTINATFLQKSLTSNHKICCVLSTKGHLKLRVMYTYLMIIFTHNTESVSKLVSTSTSDLYAMILH